MIKEYLGRKAKAFTKAFTISYTDPPGAPSSLAPRPALLRATRTNMAARASVVVAAAAVSASGLKAFGLTV